MNNTSPPILRQPESTADSDVPLLWGVVQICQEPLDEGSSFMSVNLEEGDPP